MFRSNILLPAAGALLLLVNAPASSGTGDSDWRPLGKVEGGRTQDLVMSGNALFVSSGSKLYRSEDDGENWALIHETTLGYEQFPYYEAEYFFNLLTPDPSDPDRMFTYNPDGLFRSLDGGESWQPVQHDFSYDFFAELDRVIGIEIIKLTAVAVSTDGSLIYVGDDTGRIHVSRDGDTWSPAASQPVADDSLPVQALVADPTHPTRVYTGASGIQGDNLLYRSDDGGATWEGLGSSYLESCNEFAIDTIAIDPTDGNRILAGGGRDCRMVHRSDDGGVTWTRTSELLEQGELADIVFDPSVPGTVYAVFGNGRFAKVLRSTDGGSTWQLLPAGGTGTRMHVSSSDPDILVLSAGEDGAWRSTDGGNQWVGSNKGLLNKPVDALARVPAGSDQLVGVAGDDVVGSGDGGKTWRFLAENTGMPYPLAMAVNPGNASEIYVGANGIYKSANGGRTWSYERLVSDEYAETPAVGDILINPADPSNVVLTDHENGVIYGTQDNGHSWKLYASFRDDYGAGWICSAAMAPNRPRTLYATIDGQLYKSEDGGRNWQEIAYGFHDACDVEIHPGDANTVYVSNGTGVLRTRDGGDSWNQVLATQSFTRTDIAIDPNDGERLLVADGDRILASHDGGKHWTALSVQGLPENQVDYDAVRFNIMFDPVARERYYVTNHGGYIYEGPLPGESADSNGDTGGDTGDDTDPDNGSGTGGGGATGGLVLLAALLRRRQQPRSEFTPARMR